MKKEFPFLNLPKRRKVTMFTRKEMEEKRQIEKIRRKDVQKKLTIQTRRLKKEGHWTVETSKDYHTQKINRLDLNSGSGYATRSPKLVLVRYDATHQVIEIRARKLYWGMIELGQEEHQKLKEGYAFDVEARGRHYFISSHTPVAKYEEKGGLLRYDRDILVKMSDLRGNK